MNLLYDVITSGEGFTFLHLDDSGLSDVFLKIYDSSNSVIEAQTMTEIDSSGVYQRTYTPSSTGAIVGVMSSSTTSSKSVIRVNVVEEAAPSTSGSTVISNNVGVGTREDC